MPLRSMTGYAQVRGSHANVAFTLSLKSVNHRYLDLSFRLPSDCEPLEMKLRRLLKEKLVRGHIDTVLAIEKAGGAAAEFNRDLVATYVAAFRAAAAEFSINADPDLNAALKLPGALHSGGAHVDEAFDAAVLAASAECIRKLNEMRDEEGRGMEHELRRAMARLSSATDEMSQLRTAVSKAYLEKVQARMNELIPGKADNDRILQEAAMLAERSDIEEEVVRMKTHIKHFIGLLGEEKEVGKKLDFLLQEMNRETNTLLSKTAGVSGDGLRITELGLAMKAEIEKAREQIQNIE
jgi:uncharacterized protein (TIGR00255 family)